MNLEDFLGLTKNTSVSISEEKLVADEAEVRREIDRLQAANATQQAAGTQVIQALDAQDENAEAALRALIANDSAQGNLQLSQYQQNQDRAAESDRIGNNIKEAFQMETQLTMLRENLPAKLENLDVYNDKLTETMTEIRETKNPFKWVFNNVIVKPYLEKKVQENQNQILGEVNTMAKVFVGANNAQVIADGFTTKADNKTVQANVYGATSAAVAASQAEKTKEFFVEQANNFVTKYNVRKDMANQMQQQVGIIADLYRANRSARTAAGENQGSMLKALKDMAELGDKAYDPTSIQLLASNGIDFGQITRIGATARGQLLSHIQTNGALPLVPSGVGMKIEEANELLAGGIKASQLLPDPVAGYFSQQVYRQAAAELQALGTASPEQRAQFRFVKASVDKFTQEVTFDGFDFSGALETPGAIKSIGEEIVPGMGNRPRSVLEAYQGAGTHLPAGALGKTIQAHADVVALRNSNAPGSKLAKKIAMFSDQKTEDGRPVLPAGHVVSFEEYINLAEGDPNEIWQYYKTVQKALAKSLPYAAIGAKAVEVTPTFVGAYVKPGLFGNETQPWERAPKSVEDIIQWMNETKASKKLLENYRKMEIERAQKKDERFATQGPTGPFLQ